MSNPAGQDGESDTEVMEGSRLLTSMSNTIAPDSRKDGDAANPAATPALQVETKLQEGSVSKRVFKAATDKTLMEQVFGSDGVNNSGRTDGSLPSRWYTIDPMNPWKQMWELASAFFVMYTTAVIPVRSAFYSSLNHDFDWNAWEVVDMIIDAFNLCSILLNFFSGYVTKEDTIERDLRACVAHYAKTWFPFDLLTSLPWDLIVEGRRRNVYRIIRMVRLASLGDKLGRCTTGPAGAFVIFFSEARQRLNLSNFVTRITKLLMVTAIFIHWDACFQMIVAVIEDYRPESWIRRQGLENASVFHQYTWSLFKAQSHMLSIGYGFESPYTEGEVWATYVSMVLGTAIYALFLGIISTLLIEMDAASSAFMQTMDQLNQYMQHRKLPFALRKRILNSFEYRWRTRKMMDEMGILRDLPPSLRVEVCMYTCQDLLKTVPFFEDAEDGFLSSVVTLLRPLVVLEGDVIVREGEVSREMYFIRTGLVQVSAGDKAVTQLRSGSYFGEIGLLARSKRTATITALAPCELYVLYKDDFDDVIIDYPEVELAMRKLAEHRLTVLMKHKGTGSMPGSPHTPVTPSKRMMEKLQAIEKSMGPVTLHLDPGHSAVAGSAAPSGPMSPTTKAEGYSLTTLPAGSMVLDANGQRRLLHEACVSVTGVIQNPSFIQQLAGSGAMAVPGRDSLQEVGGPSAVATEGGSSSQAAAGAQGKGSAQEVEQEADDIEPVPPTLTSKEAWP